MQPGAFSRALLPSPTGRWPKRRMTARSCGSDREKTRCHIKTNTKMTINTLTTAKLLFNASDRAWEPMASSGNSGAPARGRVAF